MNRRYAAYLGVIALLVVVNIGRWWLHKPGGQAAHERTIMPEDFRLRVDVPEPGKPGRNLFMPQGEASRFPEQGSEPMRIAVRTKGAPPVGVQPAQPLAATESEIGRLRLLGVVFHGGARQAYLSQGKENAIAAAGDTVFGMFTVEKVTVDAVEIRDSRNNITRRIPVSGK
jgi:hypothetical protein